MLLLSILPSIVLFIFIWRSDKTEKEPPKLLLKLFLLGALTVISAFILETVGADYIFGFLDHTSIIYRLIENFLIIALVEEGGKYFVLKKVTWRHPAFNYTFDAVVYAVTVSLGFATPENMFYLIDEDLSTAIIRAVFSVPGHVIYAIYMGYYYGLAKHAEAYNDMRLRDKNLKKALLVPVALHGFYDFCLTPDEMYYLIIFFVFEIIVTILAVRQIRRLSKIRVEIPEQSNLDKNQVS